MLRVEEMKGSFEQVKVCHLSPGRAGRLALTAPSQKLLSSLCVTTSPGLCDLALSSWYAERA